MCVGGLGIPTSIFDLRHSTRIKPTTKQTRQHDNTTTQHGQNWEAGPIQSRCTGAASATTQAAPPSPRRFFPSHHVIAPSPKDRGSDGLLPRCCPIVSGLGILPTPPPILSTLHTCSLHIKGQPSPAPRNTHRGPNSTCLYHHPLKANLENA